MHFSGVIAGFGLCGLQFSTGLWVCTRGESSPPLHPLQPLLAQLENVGTRSSIAVMARLLIFVKHQSITPPGHAPTPPPEIWHSSLAQKTQFPPRLSSHLSFPLLPQTTMSVDGSIHLPSCPSLAFRKSTGCASWYPNVVGAQRHASSSTIPLSQAEREGASARAADTHPNGPLCGCAVWLEELRAGVV